MCAKDSRNNNNKRWGNKFIDKRNWKSYNEELNIINNLRDLHYQSRTKLVNAVEFAFKKIGFEVENVSSRGESVDLVI